MNRFLCSRLCRCCVCLILVLVLLISWSPIRARASVLGGAALLFGDDAIAIILAVLGGLGVCAAVGSEASDLETRAIARNAMDAMEEAGNFVKDGALSLYTSVTEAWSYAVSTDMVQWLHDWLFESGVLSFGQHHLVASGKFSEALEWLSQFDNIVMGSSSTGWILMGSNGSIEIGAGIITCTENMWYCSNENTAWNRAQAIYTSAKYDVYEFISGGGVFDYKVQDGVSLGVVAPPGTDIQTEYGEYIVIVAPNGVPDTGGDGGDDEQPKIPVLPIPYLPPSEIPNVPQEDIWKGNKVEIDNPDTGDTPDPTTGTDTDDPDSGSNNPTTPNPDPGTNPGTGVPSDIGKYQIDLKDFFPFCIPFDLYRFIEILCAEPEAPVFHWEFNVFGELHSLDVDLSPWNPHAQLFRDAQVGLFIMGLLWITRKFIKW